MSENPIVSIIVPVYNQEKFLERCVQSMFAQTFSDYECILVDDGSKDASPAMCDFWAKKDGRIKVVHKQNGGVSSARNAGLENALGEYLLFVDSDDFIESQMLEALCKNAKETNADIVFCGYKKIAGDKTENIVSFLPTDKMKKKEFLEFFAATKCQDEYVMNFYCPWAKLVKKEIIGTMRFDTMLFCGEDYAFNLGLYSCVDSVSYVPHALYNYYVNEYSASKKVSLKRVLNEFILVKNTFGFYAANNLNEYKVYADMFAKKNIYKWVINYFNSEHSLVALKEIPAEYTNLVNKDNIRSGKTSVKVFLFFSLLNKRRFKSIEFLIRLNTPIKLLKQILRKK